MIALLQTWAEWMWGVTWQGALVAAGVLVLDRALPARTWPQIRHGLWCLVALKLVLPPGLASPFRRAVVGEASRPLEALAVGAGASAPAAGGAAAWSLGLAFALWLVGIAVLAARAQTRQCRLAATLRRHGTSPPAACHRLAAEVAQRLGLASPSRLVQVPDLDGAPASPMVVGLRRSTLVLPRSAAHWRPQDLENVLLHELTHLRRRDLWQEAAFALVATLYWFLPWAHHARRRAREERELLCDAAAARAADTPSYTATLLRLGATHHRCAPGPAVHGAGFPARRALLLRRLDALDHGSPRAHGRRAALSFALLACGATVALPMAAPRALQTGIDLSAPPDAPASRSVDAVLLPTPQDSLPSPEETAESQTRRLNVASPEGRSRASPGNADPPAGAPDRSTADASRELAEARSALASVSADSRAGSLHKRYAALRLLAAEAAAAPPV